MGKSKRDRDNDKKFQAVARKKDIQLLYVQLRELMSVRSKEFLAEKERVEKRFTEINNQFVKLQTDAKSVAQDCEKRILDYSYALDNMAPPFKGQGLLSSELIDKATLLIERLSKSVLDIVPEPPVVATPEATPESAEAVEEDSGEDEDSDTPEYDEALGDI